MTSIKVWTPEDIAPRHLRYLHKQAWVATRETERQANERITLARLGMMVCATAQTAYDIGPQWITTPTEWGWDDARSGA
jgi:hypothetical protein